MKLKIPLEQEKNYHMKLFPDENKLMLGSFEIPHFKFNAFKIEPSLMTINLEDNNE